MQVVQCICVFCHFPDKEQEVYFWTALLPAYLHQHLSMTARTSKYPSGLLTSQPQFG